MPDAHTHSHELKFRDLIAIRAKYMVEVESAFAVYSCHDVHPFGFNQLRLRISEQAKEKLTLHQPRAAIGNQKSDIGFALVFQSSHLMSDLQVVLVVHAENPSRSHLF